MDRSCRKIWSFQSSGRITLSFITNLLTRYKIIPHFLTDALVTRTTLSTLLYWPVMQHLPHEIQTMAHQEYIITNTIELTILTNSPMVSPQHSDSFLCSGIPYLNCGAVSAYCQKLTLDHKVHASKHFTKEKQGPSICVITNIPILVIKYISSLFLSRI